MSPASVDDFFDSLRQSGIVSSSRVEQWRSEYAELNSPAQLAQRLVRDNRLTEWQASYLLSGRHRLRFGNFILTQRLFRDSTGDGFVGRHAQLDRQVDMLFFSAQISGILAERGDWLREIAAAADIDHPQLQHIHLIDKDSGRVIVVRDHLCGRNLDDLEHLVALQPEQVASILKPLAEVLATVHEHGFAFGGVTEKDLYIDDRGKLIVTGLIESLVQQKLEPATEIKGSSESLAPVMADIQAVSAIGKKLIARMHKTRSTEQLRRLQQVLDQLSSGQLNLRSAVASMADVQPASGADTAPTTFRSQRSEPDNPIAVHSSEDRPPRVAGLPATKTGSGQPVLSKALVLGILVAVAALAVYFVGMTTGWMGWASPTAEQMASPAVSETEADLPKLSPPVEVAATPVNTDLGRQPSMLEDAVSQSSETPELPVVAVDRITQPPEEQGTREGRNLQAQATDSLPADVEDRVVEDSQPTETDVTSILTEFSTLSGADADDLDQPLPGTLADASVPTTVTTDDDDQSTPSPTSTTSPAEKPEFPTSVDLPDISDTPSVTLSELPVAPGIPIRMELLCDENISRNDVAFEMVAAGNEHGTIRMRESRSDRYLPVASFSIDGHQLRFRWQPGAAAARFSDYLRNCVLKLNTGDVARYLALRQPLQVKGFILNRQEPRTRVYLPELDFLPDNAVAELEPLDESTYGSTFIGNDNQNRQFVGKKNLRLDFSDLPEYQLVFLELSCELKNRSVLEGSLKLQLEPGGKPTLATSDSLQSAKNWLESYFQGVQNTHDTLKKTRIDDLRRQLNLTKDQLKNDDKLAKVRELKMAMELAAERAKSLRETLNKLENFYDRPVPVTIHYEVAGQRIVLATTTPPP